MIKVGLCIGIIKALLCTSANFSFYCKSYAFMYYYCVIVGGEFIFNRVHIFSFARARFMSYKLCILSVRVVRLTTLSRSRRLRRLLQFRSNIILLSQRGWIFLLLKIKRNFYYMKYGVNKITRRFRISFFRSIFRIG